MLDSGALFVVSIDASPTGHTCTIATGAQGTLETTPPLDVACTGPAVTVTLSAPAPWAFDPTQDQQALDVSLLTQAVAITVASPDGSVTSAQINGVAATLGVATAPTRYPSVRPRSRSRSKRREACRRRISSRSIAAPDRSSRPRS